MTNGQPPGAANGQPVDGIRLLKELAWRQPPVFTAGDDCPAGNGCQTMQEKAVNGVHLCNLQQVGLGGAEGLSHSQ